MTGKARLNTYATYKSPNALLDEVNLRLLDELSAEPRMSMSELARRVEMSAPAVTERVQRLEQAGVITGYRMDIDPAAVGLPVGVIVRVRANHGMLDKFAAFVPTVPQVVECYRVTGEDCFTIRLQIASVDRLVEVLDRFLIYGHTTSSIVVATPVPRRQVPLPDLAG
jgi:Lrp/AsnC family transcriptional regulator, leucine-responsive regulatory protein